MELWQFCNPATHFFFLVYWAKVVFKSRPWRPTWGSSACLLVSEQFPAKLTPAVFDVTIHNPHPTWFVHDRHKTVSAGVIRLISPGFESQKYSIHLTEYPVPVQCNPGRVWVCRRPERTPSMFLSESLQQARTAGTYFAESWKCKQTLSMVIHHSTISPQYWTLKIWTDALVISSLRRARGLC